MRVLNNMSNVLEFPLALHRGRHYTPHNQPIGAKKNHHFRSTIPQSSGHVGDGKHQE
jgi:hypothetical protein